jgi:hypothetical protein
MMSAINDFLHLKLFSKNEISLQSSLYCVLSLHLFILSLRHLTTDDQLVSPCCRIPLGVQYWSSVLVLITADFYYHEDGGSTFIR